MPAPIATTRRPDHQRCHSCPRCGYTVSPECDRWGRVCRCAETDWQRVKRAAEERAT